MADGDAVTDPSNEPSEGDVAYDAPVMDLAEVEVVVMVTLP